MKRTLLTCGYLSWDSVERRSDRYGSVHIYDGASDQAKPILLAESLDALEGHHGKLIAEVIQPVKSEHVGDLFRGFRPSLPNVGEVVLLGEGVLFIEHRGKMPHEKADIERQDDKMRERLAAECKRRGVAFVDDSAPVEVYDLIGLKPADGRSDDWLNPESLYRLHSSKVNLFFEEGV